MRGASARRAAIALASDVEAFERAGCRELERPTPLRAVLDAPAGGGRIELRMRGDGRVFGGSWALEASTSEPVLPATPRGLSARGRGVVRQSGVRFRARGGDGAAAALAERLGCDERLGEALGRVHFERVAVTAEGRPEIRHLGGSVVWMLLPPVARATPLPEGQPEAMLAALAEFRRCARDVATRSP